MSFFNDFLNDVDIDGVKNEIVVSAVLGSKLMIVGNIKILRFGDEEIMISDNKHTYKILGKGLVLSEIAKGELCVKGDIFGFVRCENDK